MTYCHPSFFRLSAEDACPGIILYGYESDSAKNSFFSGAPLMGTGFRLTTSGMTFNTQGQSFPHVFSGNPEVKAEFHIELLYSKS
jgi:hypothetical protein